MDRSDLKKLNETFAEVSTKFELLIENGPTLTEVNENCAMRDGEMGTDHSDEEISHYGDQAIDGFDDEETGGGWKVELFDGIDHEPLYAKDVNSEQEAGSLLAKFLTKYKGLYGKISTSGNTPCEDMEGY